jgi:hypothetical protein
MRVAREKLIFLALSALTGWADRAAKGPVQPDVGVRFALAFLYSCGKSGDRRIYDEFWAQLSDPGLAYHDHQRNYVRGTHCDSCIKGMITDVGAPHTPEFYNGLFAAARQGAEARKEQLTNQG